MGAKKARASDDGDVLANTRKMHPRPTVDPRGRPLFRGSEAEKQLKKDIDDELHKTMKPKQLFLTRECYQEYLTLEQFRKRIHQEVHIRKSPHGMRKRDWSRKNAVEVEGEAESLANND